MLDLGDILKLLGELAVSSGDPDAIPKFNAVIAEVLHNLLEDTGTDVNVVTREVEGQGIQTVVSMSGTDDSDRVQQILERAGLSTEEFNGTP